MVEVDDSEFPFVVGRITGDVTDDEYALWREQLSAISANAEERYVLVIDTTGAHVPTGHQFRFLTAWLRERESTPNPNLMVIAYVIPSPGVRLALKALFAIQALLIPHEVVNTYAEARQLALRYLNRGDAAVNT